MRPLKEKVSITLDGDVITRIRELAEEDDRTFSQFINLTLKRYIAYVDGTSDAFLHPNQPGISRRTPKQDAGK